MAITAAQQTNTIFTIDLTNGEIALAWASIMLRDVQLFIVVVEGHNSLM